MCGNKSREQILQKGHEEAEGEEGVELGGAGKEGVVEGAGLGEPDAVDDREGDGEGDEGEFTGKYVE